MQCPKCVIMKLPENGCRTSGIVHPSCQVVHVTPHPPPHIWAHPRDWSLQLLYLSTLFYNLLYTILQIWRLCCYLTPPSQRSSTSDSLVCTSTAASIGDPGSCGVSHLRERPSAVVSESNCVSSKVSHSSSPMTTSQSHECRCLLGSG